MSNIILAIDTSCDETSAAVTDGCRVLSNVISSQVNLHKKYGGVYPALAKRAHEEKIDYVVEEALRRASSKINSKQFQIDVVAVTQGPGLAIALEVGIRKAKQISKNPLGIRENHRIPLIAVNHLEGHIYSCLALPGRQRTEDRRQTADKSEGTEKFCQIRPFCNPSSVIRPPSSDICFPALCLIVSGGHTLLALMKDHGMYEIVGETLDDACGEALDKAAKILKLGYPGGPIIERLAKQKRVRVNPLRIRENHLFKFNSPLPQKSNLDFSYSGLKTQLFYLVEKITEEEFDNNLLPLACSFQEACFEQLIRKLSQTIKVYQPKTVICGGGVIANKTLRRKLRKTAKDFRLPILFPPKKNLTTDNAAMIGIAAYHKLLRKEFVENPETLDREPRLSL